MGLILLTFLNFNPSFRSGRFTEALVLFCAFQSRVRDMLFTSLMKQEMGWYDQTLTGDVTSRLVADTTQLGDQIGLNANIFLRSMVQFLGVLFFMAITSWKLTVLTIILVPMLVVVSQVRCFFVHPLPV